MNVLKTPVRPRQEFSADRQREYFDALARRDASYLGVFFFAVRTTGIFCRPDCSARKPLPENCLFFARAADALAAGYRPCRRCRPASVDGTEPPGIAALLKRLEREPGTRMRDQDLREMGLQPAAVRRWFRDHHGITFHGWQRCLRLGHALRQMDAGGNASAAAIESGYESESGFRTAFQKLFGTPPGSRGTLCALTVTRIMTPLGPMVAATSDEALYLLEFADRRMLETQIRRLQSSLQCAFVPGTSPLLKQIESELAAYFSGTLRKFDTPLELPGSPFQQQVWRHLLQIPYGTTASYEGLARDLGRAGAQRAVGRANGDNRLAIVVPCHRVIRSDGQLCGYGGGLRRKEWLLDHERANAIAGA
jgi:AraC family transcriptional regulator of adaptative response/methylated-DNA-[protein]-cysteine methyltransferase